jgi:hypothetical protein
MPLGPDTYRMQVGRAPILGGGMEAQKAALSQAQEYCTAQRRNFVVVAQRWERETRFEVDFQCLKAGDPDLVRPNLQPVPNVVIEDRR